jgi:hypothetical protein
MQTKAQIIEIIKQAANDTPTAIPITLLLLYGLVVSGLETIVIFVTFDVFCVG